MQRLGFKNRLVFDYQNRHFRDSVFFFFVMDGTANVGKQSLLQLIEMPLFGSVDDLDPNALV